MQRPVGSKFSLPVPSIPRSSADSDSDSDSDKEFEAERAKQNMKLRDIILLLILLLLGILEIYRIYRERWGAKTKEEI